MTASTSWETRFEQELARGETARAAGNEGMARVCARRAAGLVVEEHLRRRGEALHTPSAYDHLRYLRSVPGISAEALAAAEHLLVRLTPEHTLPVEADLIAEARALRSQLLGKPGD
jgi:hypothetical protein